MECNEIVLSTTSNLYRVHEPAFFTREARESTANVKRGVWRLRLAVSKLSFLLLCVPALICGCRVVAFAEYMYPVVSSQTNMHLQRVPRLDFGTTGACQMCMSPDTKSWMYSTTRVWRRRRRKCGTPYGVFAELQSVQARKRRSLARITPSVCWRKDRPSVTSVQPYLDRNNNVRQNHGTVTMSSALPRPRCAGTTIMPQSYITCTSSRDRELLAAWGLEAQPRS
jgi:hypothetical protein